jgi:hypothetical protein
MIRSSRTRALAIVSLLTMVFSILGVALNTPLSPSEQHESGDSSKVK